MRFVISMHAGWRRLARWLRRRLERLASHGRDIDMLLRADNRVLKDIGLTRSDMHAVLHCDVMARAAVARHNEAIAATSRANGPSPIPIGRDRRSVKKSGGTGIVRGADNLIPPHICAHHPNG